MLIEQLRSIMWWNTYDEEERLTINELVMLMNEQLTNNPHEAFSSKWMKDRLMEQLRNDTVISEINEISVIVTLRKKASNFTTSRNQVALRFPPFSRRVFLLFP